MWYVESKADEKPAYIKKKNVIIQKLKIILK